MKPIRSMILNREKRDAIVDSFKLNLDEDMLLPLQSEDAGAKVFQKGFISNPQSTAALRKIIKNVRKVMEAGIPWFIMKFLEAADVFDYIQVSGRANATFSNMEKCKASEFFMPENTVEGVKADNFANFPRYAVSSVSVELLVLLIEVLISRWPKGELFADFPRKCIEVTNSNIENWGQKDH